MRTIRVLSTLLLLLAPAGVFAQNAKLSGEVLDPTSASVANAKVKLISEGTRAELRTETDGTGTFVFPAVAPGMYELQVESEGFKTLTRSGIRLEVAATAKLQVLLEVGSVADRFVTSQSVGPMASTTPARPSTTRCSTCRISAATARAATMYAGIRSALTARTTCPSAFASAVSRATPRVAT